MLLYAGSVLKYLTLLFRYENWPLHFVLLSIRYVGLLFAYAGLILRYYLGKARLRYVKKKGKRKVQGVPQSQTAALPRPQEEEETDRSKQAQIEQTYEKH